ncbi:hypothetical protein DSO57_1028929 [Entomophthora muscae]|uniref:Uncharacterized protein n=1 Tax=Entomophthora muscae TaxID=34485 RepID=A0ACC2UAW5_9FUNG|nr:hypothetical protein DSO57_1028929 [Entomophthora muscae]
MVYKGVVHNDPLVIILIRWKPVKSLWALTITIYPLIFNGKYNNPAAYLVPMEPPLTPKSIISTPPTSDATGQNSQFLGVLYLALTGLIDSALPAAGPWAVAGKALSYLVKLGSII